MQKTSAGNKLLKLKLGIKVIAVLLLAVIVWYGQARVLKASRAVDLFQLADCE
jgi:hypothetical protein